MKRKSIGEYPSNWPEISTQIKRAASWRCIRCHAAHDPDTGYTLTVHHLDMNPSNNRWWNLLALCQRCHLHIQGKLHLDQPYMFDHSDWFKPYVAGYYAFQHGHPDDRTFVEAHLDKLLDYGRPFASPPVLPVADMPKNPAVMDL